MPMWPTSEAGPTRMGSSRHVGCASVLLDAGENIKAVSEYLGHTGAGFTLLTALSSLVEVLTMN